MQSGVDRTTTLSPGINLDSPVAAYPLRFRMTPPTIASLGKFKSLSCLVVILELSTLSLFHTAYFSFIFLSLWNAIMLFIRIQKEEKILFQNTKYKEHFSDKKRFVPFII